MTPSPPEDKDLHLMQQGRSSPLTSGETNRSDSLSGESRQESYFTRLTFIGSLFLVAIVFAVGFSHLMRHGGFSRLTLPKLSASQTQTTGVLRPDMFHVSAIATDGTRTAIVNGRQLREGEMFPIETPGGQIMVRVARIGEGTVAFSSGEEQVESAVSGAPSR